MLYKFKSKAAGDVIMLAATGDRVLRLIGKEPAAKGIIESADMPAALTALQAAIAQDEALRAERAAGTADEAADAGTGKGDAISLRQRAWPLVDMMKRSHGADARIVWGV